LLVLWSCNTWERLSLVDLVFVAHIFLVVLRVFANITLVSNFLWIVVFNSSETYSSSSTYNLSVLNRPLLVQENALFLVQMFNWSYMLHWVRDSPLFLFLRYILGCNWSLCLSSVAFKCFKVWSCLGFLFLINFNRLGKRNTGSFLIPHYFLL